MIRRLKEMLVKEFLQTARDPRMLGIIFIAPIIQMIIMAFAMTMDVTNIRTAVLDFDQSKTSRELIDEFTASRYFKIVAQPANLAEASGMLDIGRVVVVLHFPAGFENNLNAGRTARFQLMADGTESNTTAIIMGYANQIVEDYSQRLLKKRFLNKFGPGQEPASIEMATRAWYNPNLESKFYYVPGLIAIMMLMVGIMLTSLAIVREKEIGTIEQVMVTPISRFEFILGKTLPFLIIGYIIMTLMIVAAMIIFGVRVNGSWILLYCLTGIYLIGNLGLGLFISATASTQQQALLTAFFFLMPSVLLSGLMFPIHNMPTVVRYLTVLNPMRWYIEIVRGVITKGVGAEALWPAILGQSILAVLFIFMASAKFKKTMA